MLTIWRESNLHAYSYAVQWHQGTPYTVFVCLLYFGNHFWRLKLSPKSLILICDICLIACNLKKKQKRNFFSIFCSFSFVLFWKFECSNNRSEIMNAENRFMGIFPFLGYHSLFILLNLCPNTFQSIRSERIKNSLSMFYMLSCCSFPFFLFLLEAL